VVDSTDDIVVVVAAVDCGYFADVVAVAIVECGVDFESVNFVEAMMMMMIVVVADDDALSATRSGEQDEARRRHSRLRCDATGL
jgi:hypothetical protein